MFDEMFLSSSSESRIAGECPPLARDGASKFRPGAFSRSRRKSKLDATWILLGRFDCADLALSKEKPRSIAEGRWVSRLGREEAGDLGMVRVEVCDFDLTASKEGRDGSVWSGLNDDELG
jgi:hypothetical protein